MASVLPRYSNSNSMFLQHTRDGIGYQDQYPEPPRAAFTPDPIHAGTTTPFTAAQDIFSPPATLSYDPALFAETPANYLLAGTSPSNYPEDARISSPNISTPSGPSEPASAMGSPHSHHSNFETRQHNWNQYGGHLTHHTGSNGMPMHSIIVGNDYVASTGEYPSFATPTSMEDVAYDLGSAPPKGFVDPSLINADMNQSMSMPPPYDPIFHHQTSTYSPTGSSTSPQPNTFRTSSSSPFQHATFQTSFPNSPYSALTMDMHSRRQSMANFMSPASGEYASSDDIKDKQRCTCPDCGKVFKDLKAHLLTHQSSRPEKCPIPSCDYHTKGFARKYDKNRHTLTHYKGTMICGFCPGSGTSEEKAFNRADVFKRHLTTLHGVEQTPPNSRKRTTTTIAPGKKLSGYAPDATGKCSTCSETFSNAQDFYEHLDECVLRIVQQEDPAEAINMQRLAEVENDAELHETLERHDLPKDPLPQSPGSGDEDEDMSDDDDPAKASSKSATSPRLDKTGPANGVQKSKGMTHSRNGVKLSYKKKKNRRNNNDNHPRAWGIDASRLPWKKRSLCTFDGPRRLCKDDMMLAADQQVRIQLPDGKSYVTDLDYWTHKRANALLDATDEEKGAWISDDPTVEQRRQMEEIAQQTQDNEMQELFDTGVMTN